MSDAYLRLIPSSPDFVPDINLIDRAILLLREGFPGPGKIHFEISDSLRFIDQGENWEQVMCPCCNATLDLEWWQKAMDDAYKTEFQNLGVKVPCCGRDTSLNDLTYDWPAGFARFSIEISNPGAEVADLLIHQIETILGTSLRKIWAYY